MTSLFEKQNQRRLKCKGKQKHGKLYSSSDQRTPKERVYHLRIWLKLPNDAYIQPIYPQFTSIFINEISLMHQRFCSFGVDKIGELLRLDVLVLGVSYCCQVSFIQFLCY